MIKLDGVKRKAPRGANSAAFLAARRPMPKGWVGMRRCTAMRDYIDKPCMKIAVKGSPFCEHHGTGAIDAARRLLHRRRKLRYAAYTDED